MTSLIAKVRKVDYRRWIGCQHSQQIAIIKSFQPFSRLQYRQRALQAANVDLFGTLV